MATMRPADGTHWGFTPLPTRRRERAALRATNQELEAMEKRNDDGHDLMVASSNPQSGPSAEAMTTGSSPAPVKTPTEPDLNATMPRLFYRCVVPASDEMSVGSFGEPRRVRFSLHSRYQE
jgi:hypothetical protein